MEPQTQDQQKYIQKLEQRIQALEAYVRDRKENQLTYPLDKASRQIVQIDALLIAGAKETSGAPYTNDGFIPIIANGQILYLMTTS